MELPKDVTMVDNEVTTSKKDFNDLLEGIEKRNSSRHLDLSPKSHRPSSFWFDFSFGALGKSSSFNLLKGRRPLSFQRELSLVWTKRPFGFHKKVMHLSWSFLVSSRMRIGKWAPEHRLPDLLFMNSQGLVDLVIGDMLGGVGVPMVS